MYNQRFCFLLLFTLGLLNVYAQDQTVGLFTNDSRSFNGYTLFNPMASGTTYLIDNCGYEINSWSSAFQPKLSVYLLEDGSLLRTAKDLSNPDLGGKLEKFDWDGNLTWSFDFDIENYSLHHDAVQLPNGNILLISYDIYSSSEALLAGRDPSALDDELWAEKIIEIEPVGTDTINIVWEWKAWDHLIQDFDPASNNFGIVADHPELLNINFSVAGGANANTDWIHANGIAYNADLDQIILCSRNMSEVFIIDHSTTTTEATGHVGGMYGKGGDILYRYGNPAAYDRGTSADRVLFFQHDAHWITEGYPDEGKIILFNNQVSPTTSSVVIFDPPMDSAGYYSDPGISAYGPTALSWFYEGTDIHSKNISGADQLPNGNIIICPGTKGKIIEVDVEGNLLWEYVNPVGTGGAVNQGDTPINNIIFKTRRYAPDFAGFAGHDLTAGDPIELNPWPGSCQILEDTLAQLNLKVYLQGPFEGLSMTQSLTELETFPKKQPFNQIPWNYPGTESITHVPENDIVEWLLIEFRDAPDAASATSATTISKLAGFLLSDGSITQMDGISALEFYNTIIHNLYIVIWHRNHLGILSAAPPIEVGDYLNYDFTTGAGQAYNGVVGYVELSPGIWGMVAGDGNQDDVIDALDKSTVWELNTGLKGYFSGDYNLDTQVDNLDKNDFWFLNINKHSQVP